MLFLLFGNKVVRKEAGAITRACPFCGRPGPHTRLAAENYLTFFFVPLFKVSAGGGDLVRCSHCRQTFSPSVPPAAATDAWTCPQCQNINSGHVCLRCRQLRPT